MTETVDDTSKSKPEWKKNKPPKLTKVVKGYGMKTKDLLESLDTFNKASFTDENEDIKKSLEWTRYLANLNEQTRKSVKFEKHAGYGRDYPGTPMIDSDFKLTDGEREALEKFRDKKPFRADKQDYLDMIQELFIDLAKAQGHQPPAVMHTGIWEYSEGSTSFYTPHVVVLTGPKSLITALHEYTHSIGYGEVVAVWWSTNAFKLIFPKSFEKLEQHPTYSHLMRRKVAPPAETADMTAGTPEETVPEPDASEPVTAGTS